MTTQTVGLKPSGRLRRAFEKTLARLSIAAALGSGSSCAHFSPASQKPHDADKSCAEQGLREVSREGPVLMGVKTEVMFENDASNTFNLWQQTLATHKALMQNKDNVEVWDAWMAKFAHVKNGSIAEKEKAVDAILVAEFKWESDQATYNRSDYWATPLETLARKQDDCDGLNVLKYFTLRSLDVPASSLYLVRVDGSDGSAGGHLTLLVNKQEQLKTAVNSGERPSAAFSVSETASPMKTPTNQKIPPRKSYTLYHAFNEDGMFKTPAADVWKIKSSNPPLCLAVMK